ncbi:MAG TPA: hypothetical protein VF669_20195 [Tepidisphaeraceae bacterium]|jgi:hypothetical protein
MANPVSITIEYDDGTKQKLPIMKELQPAPQKTLSVGPNGYPTLAALLPNLRDGDTATIELDALSTGTIDLQKAVTLKATAKAVISYVGDKWGTIFRLGGKPVTLEGITLNNLPETFGVEVSGAGHVLRNITGIGQYTTLMIRGAKNVIVDGFASPGNNQQKIDPIYLDSGNDGVQLLNLEIALAQTGQHCIRIDTRDANQVSKNVTIGSPDAMKKRSLIVNTGTYGGSPLNVRAGNVVRIVRVDTEGHAPGFGPLTEYVTDATGKKTPDPLFSAMHLDGLSVEDCTFHTDQVVQFQAGVRGFKFTDTTIRTTAGEVLAIQNKWGQREPATGEFNGCKFYGPGALLSATSAAAGVRFNSCTYNDKPLSAQGTI